MATGRLSNTRRGDCGVLVRRAPMMEFPGEGKHFFYYVPDSLRAELPQGQFLVNAASNTTAFARAIMKIAYGHNVAELGLGGFRRLVSPQIILGQYPFVSHFVGCKLDQPPPPLARNQLHMVQRSIISFGRMRLLMQSVRLFGSSGTAETRAVCLSCDRRRSAIRLASGNNINRQRISRSAARDSSSHGSSAVGRWLVHLQ